MCRSRFLVIKQLTIMPILASEALQCQNKKFSENITPVGIEPGSLITSDSFCKTYAGDLTARKDFIS